MTFVGVTFMGVTFMGVTFMGVTFVPGAVGVRAHDEGCEASARRTLSPRQLGIIPSFV